MDNENNNDKHFAEQAIDSAKTGVMYIEEALSYFDDIESDYLRELTQKEVNKILDKILEIL